MSNKRVTLYLLVLTVTFVLAFSVGGCNLFGDSGGGGSSDPEVSTIDAEAAAGLEIIGGMMETLFESCGEPADGENFPDFSTGSYPEGMSVSVSSSSSDSVALTITITDLTPPVDDGEVEPDVTFNGSFDLVLTVNGDGSEVTITMDGSISATGTDALFGTMSVSGVTAVLPIGNDGPETPSSLVGTLTVDGTSYDLSEIDLDGDPETIPPAPTEAHYFLMSYYDDNGTDRPQIVYSPDANSWGIIHLSGTGTLRDGATDDSGRSVAVGDNGMIFSTDDGGTWSRRASGLTGARLWAVEWANDVWVAVGDNVILTSADGASWSVAWTPADASENTTLRTVAHATGNNWMAAGAAPENYLIGRENGESWSFEQVSVVPNRPEHLVRQLLWTSDAVTPWLVAAGDHTVSPPGALYNGPDLHADPTVDWDAPQLGTGEIRTVADFGSVHAATVYNGAASVATSEDSGNSWTTRALSSGLHGYPVDMTAISNGFLFVTNMGGIVRGSADGQTWQVMTAESWGSWGILFRP